MKHLGFSKGTSKHGLYFGFCLVLILALGLHLRLGAFLETEVVLPLRTDAGQYFTYAYNLRYNGTYSRFGQSENDREIEPDAFRTPGYPLFLSFLIDSAPSGKTLDRIVLVQLLISTVCIGIVGLLAMLFLPSWAALMAATLTALSPHLINANLYILTESLFCLGLLLLLSAAAKLRNDTHTGTLLLCGLLLGYTALVRPSAQYFILFLAVFILVEFGKSNRIRAVVLIVTGFLTVISPWMIRNQLSIGSISDSQLTISAAAHGMYPGFMYKDLPESYGYPYRSDPDYGETVKNLASLLKEIKRRFEEEPKRHLHWYLIKKPVEMWSWNMVQGMGDAFIYPVSKTPYMTKPLFYMTRYWMKQLHWPLVCLALVGTIAVWLPARLLGVRSESLFAARLFSLMLVYFTLITMLVAPFPRYTIPLRPMLYCMAMLPIAYLVAKARELLPRIRPKPETAQ